MSAGRRHLYEFHEFVPVVLRLYEQAEQVKDRTLRNRSLDCNNLLREFYARRQMMVAEMAARAGHEKEAILGINPPCWPHSP